MKKIQYGVSPAFFIAKFGENFTPQDVCDSLEEVRRLGFAAFQTEIVFDGDIDTGYNLNTGHAWASGHPVESFLKQLSGMILGTHLCDNDGVVNLSLRPGKGSINFSL